MQLAKNRYVIEHCFGVLKQKFRQMYHIKLRKMEYIVHFIRAACVLHNIALADQFLMENEDPPQNILPVADGDLFEDEIDLDEDGDSQRIRNFVVHNLP